MLVAIRCIGIVGSTIAAFYAVSVLPMAEVYALIFCAPVLTTLLAIPVLGERVHLIRWIAVVLCLAGVIIVLQTGKSELSLGHLSAFMVAVFVALAAMATHKIGAREHGVTLITDPLMLGFVVNGIVLFWVYKPFSGTALVTLGAIGLLSVAVQTLLVMAYRCSEAQFVAPVHYSQMMWAVFVGSLFFNEYLTKNVLLGSAVIILPGLLFVGREVVSSVRKPVLHSQGLRTIAQIQLISCKSETAKEGV